MKVYLLENTADYYTNELIGIYSSKDKAEQVKKHLVVNGRTHSETYTEYFDEHDFDITEHEVDKVIK